MILELNIAKKMKDPASKEPARLFQRADGGTRTRTPVRAGDFKSPVSAIPPHPHNAESISLA